MTIKTITITEEAYNCIGRLKHENESFSKLFLRIGGCKMQVKDLAGAIKITDMEAREWQKRVKKSRENINKNIGERYVCLRQLCSNRASK